MKGRSPDREISSSHPHSSKPMPRLLLLLTLPPEVTEQYRLRLGKAFPELTIDVAADAARARPMLREAEILITFGQMMKNLKLDFADAANLKWVQALGTGLDGITDQPALKPGVVVTSLHGVHGAPVSEAAIAAMLALSRDLPGFVRAQDQHQWKRWPARLLHHKTVGILGVGIIAEALAPKCKAMGMTVVGLSSAPRQVPGFDSMHPVSELLTIVPHLDYFVLLTPYSRATHNMINAEVFAAMKPASFLVNLARGGVVDEPALVSALRDKVIAGAALDVFNEEPLPSSHPFWTFPNVIITTHQGGFCDTYVDLAMPILEHNMRCFLSGNIKAMRNLVRPAA
jgi:D-2-hydroxyacid dehydrogenase (NADP+)